MKKASLTKTEQRFLWTAALVCAVCVALAFGFAVPRQTGPGRAAGSETPLIQLARVDLNTAGQDALCTLPGVGEQRAQAIIEEAKARATDTDWMDLMTQTGFLQEHSVSVSGGSDKTRFFISGSYLTQQGILKKSSLDRYSTRFNIDHKATKWLDLGLKATVGYSKTNFADPEAGAGRQNWGNPWFTTLLAYPYESPDDWYNVDNPTLITKYYDRETGRLKTVASVYAKASITDWLSVKTNFGLDFMYNRNVSTLHRDHPNAQQNHGYYGQTSSELFRYT